MLQNKSIALELTTSGTFIIHSRSDPATWLTSSAAVASQGPSGTPQLQRPLADTGSIIHQQTPYSDQQGTGIRLTAEFTLPNAGLRLQSDFILYDALPAIRLQVGACNVATHPIPITHLMPLLTDATALNQETMLSDAQISRYALSISGHKAGWACYQEGWQSWSYAGALAPGKPAPLPRSHSLRASNHPQFQGESHLFHSWGQITTSEAVALVGFPQSSPALLVGFLRAIDQAGQILIDPRGGRLAAVAHAEGTLVAPGETCWSEPVLIGFGAEAEILRHYTTMTARKMHARADREMPTGWCSWYYYFTRVSEHDILENLQALSPRRNELPLRLVQIDDGYQTAVGDWTSINDKFPSGMKQIASAIREQGFQPGLWLAPFTATANSQLFREHPDWLLRDERGRPIFGGKNWNSTMHGLDCTHPQVQDWLRRLFSTLVEEWGYPYLKLDFLFCAALPGLRYRQDRTSVQALREGLQTIRATVGDDIYLLGCGCPILPAIGLVDAMRIGPDVAPHWPARFHGLPVPASDRSSVPSAINAIRNSLTRAWMHRAFWVNDPDCLLVRDTETKLTHDEICTLASVIGLTGGMLLLSDPMHTLREESWSLATLLMPPLDQAAQPHSWLDEPWPSSISTTLTRPWGSPTLAGLFNWTGHPQHLQVPLASLGLAPGQYHVCEFWTQRYLGIVSENIPITLPIHGSAVLAIQPATSRPAPLSTDLHLGQGAAELRRFDFDEDRRQLEWEIDLGRNAAGSLRLYLPPPLRPGTLNSSATQTSLRPGSQPGEYIIQATIPRRSTFTLSLETADA